MSEIRKDENEVIQIDTSIDNINVPKKRGRKPKNSKIITQQLEQKQIETLITHTIEKPNVILHLKCSLSDLENTSNTHFFQNETDFLKSTNIDSSNETFCNNMGNSLSGFLNFNESDSFLFQNISDSHNFSNYSSFLPSNANYSDIKNDPSTTSSNLQLKKDDTIIEKKLAQLQTCLNKNDIHKSSCCFWCTCDFKTTPIYIPKYIHKNSYNVYGNFCSPECATGYLMNEKIDSSIKFERYALLNNLYSEIFNYNNNINCAPPPYYILNKFCGNLTIEEYRNLNKNKHIFILDKPLIKIMPELHQEKNIGF